MARLDGMPPRLSIYFIFFFIILFMFAPNHHLAEPLIIHVVAAAVAVAGEVVLTIAVFYWHCDAR
jgi:hypothetical protein